MMWGFCVVCGGECHYVRDTFLHGIARMGEGRKDRFHNGGNGIAAKCKYAGLCSVRPC